MNAHAQTGAAVDPDAVLALIERHFIYQRVSCDMGVPPPVADHAFILAVLALSLPRAPAPQRLRFFRFC
jgi:hypothetical protein